MANIMSWYDLTDIQDTLYGDYVLTTNIVTDSTSGVISCRVHQEGI